MTNTLQSRADALKQEITQYSNDAQSRINSEREDIQNRQQNLAKMVRDAQRNIDNLEGRLSEVEALINAPEATCPDGKCGLSEGVKDAEIVQPTA